MSEVKDPAIKLFGKTIPVPEIPAGSGDSAGDPASSSGDVVDDGADQNHASSTNSCKTNDGEEENEIDQDTIRAELTEDKKEDGAPTESSEHVINLDIASRSGEESATPSYEKDATTLKTSRTEEELSETSQEKTLKKPDKILPCPRCNSMDTKFCYYNNYNVNQPRHFCKNCQRYWTAGGAMRNVPVGAGRRKNKNSAASHHRQITASDAPLQNPHLDFPNGVQHPSLNCNGTVLTFGSDARLCESMASVLNLTDKTMNNCTTNGFNKPGELSNFVPYAGGEKVSDANPNSSSIVTSTQPMDGTTTDKSEEQVVQNFQSFPPQVPYFHGAPWPFAWNPAQWSSAVPPLAFFPPGFTMPFYPSGAYWGCTVPGAWNIPWIAQPLSPNSTTPHSPTLGKHSREENVIKSNDTAGEDGRSKGTNKEKCLWVPKTLRIDDLGEAAKSSIWTTLGIKTNMEDSIHGEGKGIFKAFPSKVDEENDVKQNSQVLQANPAAMSRSINFHETS